MNGRILDLTCSAKRHWPSYADVRIDVNPATRPDVIADASRLPFADSSFAEAYFDPPHFVSFGDRDVKWRQGFVSKQPTDFQRFGYWPTRTAWREFLRRFGPEIARVLETTGTLHAKIPDGTRSHGRMIDLADLRRECPQLVLVRCVSKRSESVQSRRNVKRGRSQSVIHYADFRAAGPI